MIYLKAPIGADGFVEAWLRTKLDKLRNIVMSIAQIPWKHEAFTLLRSCASECRVMYLMRVIPPRQLQKFMQEFDAMLKKGFEAILGIEIDMK